MNNIVDISFVFLFVIVLFKMSLSFFMFYQFFLDICFYLNLKKILNCFYFMKMFYVNLFLFIEQLMSVLELGLFKWMLCVLYILVFVVGIIGNLVVCCVVMRCK